MTENQPQTFWTCLLCNRSKFTRAGQPHRCCGQSRKRFKKAAIARGVENCFIQTNPLANKDCEIKAKPYSPLMSEQNNIQIAQSLAEMESLQLAIIDGDYEMKRVQMQLVAMQKKQIARQHELGFQKARMGLRPGSQISDEAKPGHRMVIVQTDSGIATRWIPETPPTPNISA